MLRKWNRILSIILAIALMGTTFNSDIASIRVFAEDEEVMTESSSEDADDAEDADESEDEEDDSESEEEYSEPEETQEPEEVPPADAQVPEEGGEDGENEDAPEAGTEEEAAVEEASEESSEEVLPETELEEEAAVEPVAEEKLVTVTYKASLGGRVSRKSETIDINDKDASFEGATATAANKYYQFTGWFDEDGKNVCSAAEFVPTGIEKDCTFKAEFMKLSDMPAQTFEESDGSINVYVSADEGIFPADTKMYVKAIPVDAAIDAAKDALGESVTDARGADITFKNADGEEIEPADSRYVHVSISLADTLEGESFSVIHKDNNGGSDKIAGASADGAEFEANSFSVYIVAGSGDSDGDVEDTIAATREYIFKIGEDVFNRQYITGGDTVLDPGIPHLEDNQEFFGWYDKDDNRFEAGLVETVSANESYVYTARIQTTYYITFYGIDDVVSHVQKVVLTGSNTMVELDDVHVDPEHDYQAFKGWGLSKTTKDTVTEVNVAETTSVYAVIVNAYWITFNENDGAGGGAEYIGPRYVMENDLASTAEPDHAPVRRGYTFGGWYEHKGENDGEVTGNPFNWNSKLTGNITLYAKWTENLETEYTVIIWTQKIGNSKNAADGDKTYDYYSSTVMNGRTNHEITASDLGNATRQRIQGFHYADRFTVVRNSNGDNIPESVIRAKGDTVVNVYYDRNFMTINFNLYSNRQWSPSKVYTGLYGQTLEENGYTWPTDHVWRESESYGQASGTRLNLLTQFVFGDPSLTTLELYGEDVSGSCTVRYILQNTDGSWPSTTQITSGASGGTFYITDKFNGFQAYQFRTKGRTYGSWSDWKSVGTKTSNGNYSNSASNYQELEIRFKRLSYKLEFKDNFQGNISDVEADEAFDAIPYEKSLTTYKTLAPSLANKPGYRFAGWYEDQNGTTAFNWDDTMPAANKVVYAHYEVVRYHIVLKPMGGQLPSGQSDDFYLDYGDIIDRTSLFLTKNGDYQLVGWIDKDTNFAYGFGAVDKDTTLIAKWRNGGIIKVVYNAAEGGSNPPVDSYNYSGDSAVVVCAPPSTINSGYMFLGWTIDGDTSGKIYYPNNCFDITPEIVKNIDGVNTVTLTANYQQTGPDGINKKTTITYYANNGTAANVVVSKNANGEDLLVNESVVALTVEQCGFEYPGYEFLGWHKYEPGDTVDISGGQTIAANDKEPLPNSLYAVWKRTTGTYIIEYYKGEVTYDEQDDAHYLGRSKDPVTAPVGESITLSEIQLNAKRPTVGYKAGEQQDAPYVMQAGDDNVIYVLYPAVEIKVVITGSEVSKEYDGQPLSATGYKATVVTEGTGYDADYIGLKEGVNIDYTATNVADSGKTDFLDSYFVNTNTAFDNDSITIEIGEVGYNKVTITPKELTVVTPDANKEYDGEPLTAEGSISGFVAGESAEFTTTGTITEVGDTRNTYEINWQNGNALEGNYTVKETVGTLVITESSAKITVITTGGTHVYDGKTYGAEVDVQGVPKGYHVDTAKSNATATHVADGIVTATADQLIIKNASGVDVTGKLTIEYKNGSIQITPAPVQITTDSDSKVYDGDPLTAPGRIEGLVNDEEVSFEVTGTITEVGDVPNTYTLAWDKSAAESDYEITAESVGRLVITESKNLVVITTTGGSFEYDGKEHGAISVDVSNLPKDYWVDTAESTTTVKDVDDGTKTVTANVLIIRNKSGEDVTSRLEKRFVNGEINITPRTLTVVTPDAEKPYDGNALTAEGTITGYVDGESANFTTTGTISEVGETPNTYELSFENTTAKESNYTVSETIGTLKITDFVGEIIVTTTGGIFPYSGQPYGVTDISVDGLPDGYTVETASCETTVTDVTVEDVPVNCDTLVIVNRLGEDVTDKLEIRYVPGFIRVTALDVTVLVRGDRKVYNYNGKMQEAKGYDIISASLETYPLTAITFKGEAIAKRQAVGKTAMGLKESQFGNSDSNYNVRFEIEDGSVEILALPQGAGFKIFAKTDNVTKEYTGETFEDFDYDVWLEGPAEGTFSRALERVSDFLSSIFKPLTVGAADTPTGVIEREVNGAKFYIEGIKVDGKGRDKGDYPLTINATALKITDSEGNVVTDQFDEIVTTNATLTITPMPIIVESEGAEMYWTGKPLTNNNVSANRDWGIGDSVEYDVTGSQTNVGKSQNLFTIVPKGDTKLTNYEIEYKYGWLVVKRRSNPDNPDDPDDPDPTPIPDTPTPTAATPTPEGTVLGARRDEAAVLGARRAKTDDETNDLGRMFAIVIAAAVAVSLISLTKKKEEEEQ